jgi:hypothetical protein
MAQIRCEILAHPIKLITPTAATVPLGIATAQPRVSGKVCPNSVLTARGTEGSNLLSSSGESANFPFLEASRAVHNTFGRCRSEAA